MRVTRLLLKAPLCLALLGTGQAEPVRVESLTFEGVHLVDESRLRDALETREWPFLTPT